MLRWMAIGCAVLGLLVGMYLQRILQNVDDKKEFKLTFLRTPLAAAIFVPIGIALILFFVYNHTIEVFEGIVWPDFYSKNWLLCSVFIAVIAGILAGFLNILEHAFDQSNIPKKAGILCFSPLAIIIGFLSMLGMVGSGSLCGIAIGRIYECPITGAWTGACIAVVVLAVEGGIFWPVLLPDDEA